ncbi:MAG: O-antigen ligase family protein [Proteobacteria bacterium]|nr:O-antigen ligase family protein [Pseudomonadota bacterium]
MYIVWSIVTLAIGIWLHPGAAPDGINELKDSMLGVLLLFVVEKSVTDWVNLKRVLLFMLLPLPYILRVAWAQHSSVSAWHYNDDLRLQGTFALLGANEFAAFCVTAALMLFALLLAGGLTKIWRALLAGGVVCMSLGVLWAYSRTAYVAILLGAAVILLLWRGRWKMVIPVALAIAIVPPFLPHSVSERFDSTHVEGAQVDESTDMRYAFWRVAINEWQKHPIFGTGNYTFAAISPYNMDTHNLYMRTLAEEGTIGIVILVGLFLSMLRAAWRTFRDCAPGGVGYALGLGMLGTWPALAVSNFWGDRFTYVQMIGYFWVFLALMLKARELVLTERTEASHPAPFEPQAKVSGRRYATPRRSTLREQSLQKKLASK